MKDSLQRATDQHNVMSAIHPKPKPERIRNKTGRPRPPKTNRKKLTDRLDDLCRELTKWRDGVLCVEVDIDCGHCYGVSQWGHVIPQANSAWLKHDPGNSFRQCSGHNGLHSRKQNDSIYYIWFASKFGPAALLALRNVAKEHANKKRRTIPELQEQLAELQRLYDDRHSHGTDTLEELVKAGYYGDIVKTCWVEEGKI